MVLLSRGVRVATTFHIDGELLALSGIGGLFQPFLQSTVDVARRLRLKQVSHTAV